MSERGQSRRFDQTPITSAIARLADIFRIGWHVSKVPIPDIQVHAAVCTQMAGFCSTKSGYVSISFKKMNGTR
jgi:hypothetical protein